MWKRRKIKKKAKRALGRNYWLCFVMSLVLSLLVIAGSASVGDDVLDTLLSFRSNQTSGTLEIDLDIDDPQDLQALEAVAASLLSGWNSQKLLTSVRKVFNTSFVLILLNIFVFSVLEVGAHGFFVDNARGNGQFSKLFCGFKASRYGTIVGAQFTRSLYTFLWSLLLVLPGIIKHYSYCMIPYILADDPEITRHQAFKLSRRMMRGHKWRTFLLDVSFVLWWLLSALTAGLLGYFFVNPYYHATRAELYLALKEEYAEYQKYY